MMQSAPQRNAHTGSAINDQPRMRPLHFSNDPTLTFQQEKREMASGNSTIFKWDLNQCLVSEKSHFTWLQVDCILDLLLATKKAVYIVRNLSKITIHHYQLSLPTIIPYLSFFLHFVCIWELMWKKKNTRQGQQQEQNENENKNKSLGLSNELTNLRRCMQLAACPQSGAWYGNVYDVQYECAWTVVVVLVSSYFTMYKIILLVPVLLLPFLVVVLVLYSSIIVRR